MMQKYYVLLREADISVIPLCYTSGVSSCVSSSLFHLTINLFCWIIAYLYISSVNKDYALGPKP
jgi:hypothetical protein